MAKATFAEHENKFATALPQDQNAFLIYGGFWKFGYDQLSFKEIYDSIMLDARPRWCAEFFEDFNRLRIAELGPADGYNTAALEYHGATNVTAIEGNVDAFIRCLILKNHLSLRARFMLGDFVRHFEQDDVHYDLIYASGILYHLIDPLSFLHNIAKKTKHLFLWTHFYDADCIPLIENEANCFKNQPQTVHTVADFSATYYRREYRIEHVVQAGYIGGLHEISNWITRKDLFRALETYGFKIQKVFEDPMRDGIMPAVSILASRS